MPSLNVTVELGAGVEDIIVILLVMDRSSKRVSKHALGQRGQLVRRVLLEVGGGGGDVGIGVLELIKLIFGCAKPVSQVSREMRV